MCEKFPVTGIMRIYSHVIWNAKVKIQIHKPGSQIITCTIRMVKPLIQITTPPIVLKWYLVFFCILFLGFSIMNFTVIHSTNIFSSTYSM